MLIRLLAMTANAASQLVRFSRDRIKRHKELRANWLNKDEKDASARPKAGCGRWMKESQASR
jgi:hypothetical protein